MARVENEDGSGTRWILAGVTSWGLECGRPVKGLNNFRMRFCLVSIISKKNDPGLQKFQIPDISEIIIKNLPRKTEKYEEYFVLYF